MWASGLIEGRLLVILFMLTGGFSLPTFGLQNRRSDTELHAQVHSRALFSIKPTRGAKIRKMLKYSRDATWPIIT